MPRHGGRAGAPAPARALRTGARGAAARPRGDRTCERAARGGAGVSARGTREGWEMRRLRACFVIAAAFTTAAAFTAAAFAQAPEQPYPAQMVRLVVPFSAGSVTDILARTIA